MKSNKKTALCFAVAATTISLGAYFEFNRHKVAPIYLPLSWGVVKDIVDPILIVLFPWNGWIFLIPLLLALFLRLSLRTISCLWLVSFLAMGALDTLISFQTVSFPRIVRGIALYAWIFGFLFLTAIFLKALYRMRKNEP